MKIRKIRKYYAKRRGGPHRCIDYDAGCINCQNFKFFDRTGRFASYEELHEIMMQDIEVLESYK